MNENTNNLPCPFCGDDNLTNVDMTYFHSDGEVKGNRIKCATCGAQAPEVAWNTRIGLTND